MEPSAPSIGKEIGLRLTEYNKKMCGRYLLLVDGRSFILCHLIPVLLQQVSLSFGKSSRPSAYHRATRIKLAVSVTFSFIRLDSE